LALRTARAALFGPHDHALAANQLEDFVDVRDSSSEEVGDEGDS
jgi:hypothetical protein